MTDSEIRSFYELMWPTKGPWGVAYAPSSFELWLRPYEKVLSIWATPTFHLQGGTFADYQPNDAIGVRHLCSEKMRHIIDTLRHPTDLIEWLPVIVTDASPPPPPPPPAPPPPAGIQLAFPELEEFLQPLEVAPNEVSDPGEVQDAGERQEVPARQYEHRQYYVLHLLEELDVVDTSKSIMAKGKPPFVVKPHIILDWIGEHQIFQYEGGGDNVCVSNELRLALLEAGCIGCHFWELPAS